jgi:hypothetical protein
MAMNLCHRMCCSSDRYFKAVEDSLYFRDACNPVHPQTFPERLPTAGFDDVQVEADGHRLRWRAGKAGR